MKFDVGGAIGNGEGIVVVCASGVGDGSTGGISGVVVSVGLDCCR